MKKIQINFKAFMYLFAFILMIFGTICTASAQDKGIVPLPVQDIENALGDTNGNVTNGVLDIEISRSDIGSVVTSMGSMTLTPNFEIHGHVFFQPAKKGGAAMNGYLPVVASEANHFIAALIKNQLVFQAFIQHVPTHPAVWFIHFSGQGDSVQLATSLAAALTVTATPMPQTAPSSPTSPLDAQALATALHGTAAIGDGGVVTITIPRKNKVKLGHAKLFPESGVSTSVEFNPTGGTNADVVVNFSMIGTEVTGVVTKMLTLHWSQGALNSQEIQEKPQLYFDHLLKSGDSGTLAAEIRQGLDLTDSQ